MNVTDKRKLTNPANPAKLTLNEIIKTENCFNSKISKRKSCSKILSKYVAAFDYIDKILIVLNAKSGEVWIISSVSVVGAPVGIVGASFTLYFPLTRRTIKKLLSIKKNKKKKHDKILMLDKSKLNSIKTLVSQALIDMEISHEEFITTLREKDKYKKMQENVWNVSRKKENMRLNSVNSRT